LGIGRHLLKTFWAGPTGWADTQLPDGTGEWTSPSGRTYTTKPGGSLFFAILATPTGEAAIRKLTAERGEGGGLMMPRRKRTRQREHRPHHRRVAHQRADPQTPAVAV
jgi:hypothetical protein